MVEGLYWFIIVRVGIGIEVVAVEVEDSVFRLFVGVVGRVEDFGIVADVVNGRFLDSVCWVLIDFIVIIIGCV